MKTPKHLEQFAKDHNLILLPITYKAQGFKLKRKGFDLCKPNGEIIISFEPVSFNSYPDKWLIRYSYSDYKGKIYITRIDRNFLNGLDITAKSHVRNLDIKYI